ncbi:site-2 protease family protein [Candidatus Woesearchaeota archaeon]|nr:site-2 protease family protein [Candidatus Woesearchaeota archaeon]
MKKNVHIGKLFGIDVELHYSWFFIFALLGYALSRDFYPYFYPGFETHVYWIIGFISSFLLFFSVIFHEFMHSLVAKNNNIKVDKITLFLFGGIAQIHEKNMSPGKEFKVAIAGPLASVWLGLMFLLIFRVSPFIYVTIISSYLVRLNFILAIFNMIPGFPLDGGRVFRAIVWKITKDLKKATKMASVSGKAFGFFLGAVGIFEILVTGTFGGIWFVLLGAFIFFLAEMSYEQMVLKDILEKIKVNDVLNTAFIVEKPTMTVKEAIEKYGKKGINSLLVGKKDDILGVLDLGELPTIPETSIAVTKIGEVCNKNLFSVKPEQKVYNVFVKMISKKLALVPVYKKNKLFGVVERDYIIKYLRFKFKFSTD